jgi:hypothetical protein
MTIGMVLVLLCGDGVENATLMGNAGAVEALMGTMHGMRQTW